MGSRQRCPQLRAVRRTQRPEGAIRSLAGADAHKLERLVEAGVQVIEHLDGGPYASLRGLQGTRDRGKTEGRPAAAINLWLATPATDDD